MANEERPVIVDPDYYEAHGLEYGEEKDEAPQEDEEEEE